MSPETRDVVDVLIVLAVLAVIWTLFLVYPALGQDYTSGHVNGSVFESEVRWLGYPIAATLESCPEIDEFCSPSIYSDVEIGLREDGVVVWRER